MTNTPIRRHFDEATANWYFSIVDVIAVLSESVNPRDYWFRMKVRVKSDDGLELSTIYRQLKLKSSDGKKYATDCANVEGLLRIFQSAFSRIRQRLLNCSPEPKQLHPTSRPSSKGILRRKYSPARSALMRERS
jgi:hypothetical protein